MSAQHSASSRTRRRSRRTATGLLVTALVLGSAALVGASGNAGAVAGLVLTAHGKQAQRAVEMGAKSRSALSAPTSTRRAASSTTSSSARSSAPTSATSATSATSRASTSAASASRTATGPASPVAQQAACQGAGRVVSRVSGTYSTQWAAATPADNATYDLSGVRSSAYPSSNSPFALGVQVAGLRTCVLGGTIQGGASPSLTWETLHAQYNAACVRIVGRDWMQVSRMRCDNVEDGIRPLESSVNGNNAQIRVTGTYLSHIRDDCIENDYTIGGEVSDSLFESCNTGISERPSGGRSWSTPSSETLTLDHVLIGLYQTPHAQGGMGENTLFKWSSSGNHLVVKCSTFKVDSVSLNGKGAMSLPPGTVVDDSQCPNNPSTIVWLGGGAYPGQTGGMRVVSDPAVWTSAVGSWKAAHGF